MEDDEGEGLLLRKNRWLLCKDRADDAFEQGNFDLALELYRAVIQEVERVDIMRKYDDLVSKCKLNSAAIYFMQKDWPKCACECSNIETDFMSSLTAHQCARVHYFIGCSLFNQGSPPNDVRKRIERVKKIAIRHPNDFSAEELSSYDLIYDETTFAEALRVEDLLRQLLSTQSSGSSSSKKSSRLLSELEASFLCTVEPYAMYISLCRESSRLQDHRTSSPSEVRTRVIACMDQSMTDNVFLLIMCL